MALNFPDSPSDGDTFSGYSYNSSTGAWVSSSLNNTGPIVSDTAPSNPINGDFWFDSSSARLYMRYDDGSSSQWLSLSASGADGADGADGTPTIYANTSVLPSSGNSVGNLAFATLTKSLHIWDGAEWDRVSTGNNETPRLTTIPSSTLTIDGESGANGTITIAATDPEGFPITYSHDTNPANPNQVTSITNSGGTFTLVPSTNTAHAGNFTLRLKANDGISTISHAVTVTLAFIKSYRYIKVVINSVQGGGSQAQVTELSIADTAQTTSQVTAQTYTTYGSASQNPNGMLDNNTTGNNTAEYTNLNFSGGTWTAEIDLGQAYNVGSGIKYLQIGTSDSANRFPNSVTVYGANQSNYSDQEAIVTNASVPAYDGVRQMKLVDLDP